MKWNWQQLEWPQFSYDAQALKELESTYLHGAGIFIGASMHLEANSKTELIVNLASDEAMTTSEIEGELLNRDSVQSSIRGHFGLKAPATKKGTPAEKGIADMMIDLYTSYSEPLSHAMLFRWHAMLNSGQKNLIDIGRYRTHTEAMQVVSGPEYRRKVHFEAAPSKKMMFEMTRFIDWFNATKPSLTRAGIAHLYFVCIHPFEDGNGRIGRAIVEKSLAELAGQPTLLALSKTILKYRRAYYDMLEASNKDLSITPWLIYFGKTILDAQKVKI